MAAMNKPVDISKFRKGLTKNINGIKGISTGFNDPKTWLSTGSYVLNYLISSDFFKGVPLEGKLTQFAGDSGAGKSYISSGNIVRSAQEQGIFVVLVDTENALDEDWLHRLGVDTSPEMLIKASVSMIDDVAKIMSDFITGYKADFADLPQADRPKVLFVIDSLGMLLTPTDKKQFEDADMKGDMGRKAKQTTALCRNIVSTIASENIGVIVTNHTYKSADMFSPGAVIAGGAGLEYASSIVVNMEKRKLKEDEDGNKTSDVSGIRSAVEVRKSRYGKPFERAEIKIPYLTGLNPFSGIFDLFETQGLLTKVGNKYSYKSVDGTEILEFRKKYTDEILMKIMAEHNQHPVIIARAKSSVAVDEIDITEE